jgi:glycine/D-amino acid oxidase-like deaminating enzyme
MLTDRGSRGSRRSGADLVEAGETPDASGTGLSERARAILDFERTWWRDGGAKEPAIRTTFALSATRYYQLLSRLIDTPAAYAYDPLVVLRLRRQRDRRRRARFTGSPAEGGPR